MPFIVKEVFEHNLLYHLLAKLQAGYIFHVTIFIVKFMGL